MIAQSLDVAALVFIALPTPVLAISSSLNQLTDFFT